MARRVGVHTPLLVFNRELAGDFDLLALDNRHGAQLATEHLLALGHRRIAFFGGHRDSSSCRQRREGFVAALADAGIAAEPGWMIETAPTRLEAARQAGALFARDPAPTAAVCYNDAVALGLQLGLAARGRQSGRDFAVVGFDDIPEAAVSSPPLTTIGTDPRARGRQAAYRILARSRILPRVAEEIRRWNVAELSERLDLLEDQVLERPDNSLMDSLHTVKADLLMLRRAIWPMRKKVFMIMGVDWVIDAKIAVCPWGKVKRIFATIGPGQQRRGAPSAHSARAPARGLRLTR